MSTTETETQVAETDDMLDALFAQALNRHQAEDWQAAEEFYQKILVVMPTQPNVNYNLGMLKAQLNQTNESLDYFKAALTADENEPKYWISYINALVEVGQKKLAIDTLIKGLELGLHGEEVNALVTQLTHASEPAMPEVPVTIANYAGVPDVQAMMQKKQEVEQVNAEQSTEKVSGKSLQHYLDNPKIQKVLAVQQSGKLQKANKQWLELLKYYPNHPVILTCLGTIAMEQSRMDDAVKWLEQSLAIVPDQASALSYLSIAKLDQKQFETALEYASKAITINPQYSEAYTNRGSALRSLKRFSEAIASYQKALQLNADNVDALFNLALVYVELAQYKQASTYIKQVVDLNPQDIAALSLAGSIHRELKIYDKSLDYYHKTLELNDQQYKATFGRGLTYLALREYLLARDDFKKAAKLAPDYPDAFHNLGMALRELGEHEAALTAYNNALAVDDQKVNTYVNKGLLFVDMQRLDEALDCYEKALTIDPNSADARWNKALRYLLLGDFKQGWSLYEYRWQSVHQGDARSISNKPLWLGEQAIAEKKLFVYPEQGMGDYIQFCRYFAEVEQLGAELIIEVPPALMKLVSSLQGNYQLIEAGNTLPDYDYQCPIMSLPLALKTELATVPAQVPYLYADAQQASEWQARIDHKQFNVGLIWSGSQEHSNDHHRSIALDKFSSLCSVPVTFHAIQKEIRSADEATLKQLGNVHTYQDALTDFSETAALVEQMDLVISVDTSVAHLVGAMGRPCWLLLPYAPDFRWMLNTDESPWYPSMRLFRQAMPNDWESVMQQVKQALEQEVKAKKKDE